MEYSSEWTSRTRQKNYSQYGINGIIVVVSIESEKHGFCILRYSEMWLQHHSCEFKHAYNILNADISILHITVYNMPHFNT